LAFLNLRISEISIEFSEKSLQTSIEKTIKSPEIRGPEIMGKASLKRE
jgi:hypothetical protein